MNTPIPIIRLEFESMRHSLMLALSEYTVQLDSDLHHAVDAFCTPSNLKHIIESEADRVLEQVIREQVKKWFTSGEGREVIKSAVEQKLRAGETWTPLDDRWTA
jgi:hypothetical protein